MGKISTFKHIAAIGIIGAMFLSGCGVTVREHHNRPGMGYSHDHRRDYDHRMQNNDRRIAELRNSNHRDDVLVIEVKHNNMKKKLNEFKGSTRHEWNSFKREFNHDMKDMDKSLKGFSKKSAKK
ncbi:MAG: hypothetical protein PHI95_06975 [Bacteroidales bacterium]|nr:hypothetical protein [Bacteroidales bacterium]